VALIEEAAASGVRVKKACEVLGISIKSYIRWKAGMTVDRRKGAEKSVR